MRVDTGARILSVAQLLERVQECRREDKSIVFTNGCFDLLHIGHKEALEEAAGHGDVLIVAVNSNESTRRLKGVLRPIVPAHHRAAMLAALACVDFVVIFEEDTPCDLLQLLQPDILVKGGTTQVVVGRDIVERYGGEVCVTAAKKGWSTTKLLRRIYRIVRYGGFGE